MRVSPKQFLKSRRPEQFSDSEVVSESQINSAVLEYYLDTLSSRSQEIEFENFGIRLCKAAITPNLLPNTGPTGGGDGKVDSETYPVSEETALGWHTAISRKSASERWGFAFSVKKTWSEKVRDDVKKLHETGRDYKVAYFVSSRSIRSKDKARLQDELSAAYGIDVRILDRNWIIKEVFENKRQEIVAAELHVEGVDGEIIKKGALDFQKKKSLTELNKAIEKAISENNLNPFVVDNAIDSAILTRELEKPRTDIDGHFARAERLAGEYGNAHQQLNAVYQAAWTAFWWHEDFYSFIEKYPDVETAAIKVGNPHGLERLTNLWFCLNTLKHRGEQGHALVQDDFFKQHTELLKEKLAKVSGQEEESPNAALYARTLLLKINLAETIYAKGDVSPILVGLKEVIEKSKHLVGFPFKPLVQVLTEAGDILENNPEYEDLFQAIVSATEERDGETSSATLTLERGKKLIELGRHYDAIRILGNSLIKLHKYESRDDAVRALFFIGIAYGEVGLVWAARGSFLSAASLATSEFWNRGNINTMQAACYSRLKWLELRIGRVPQALDWHSIDSTIRHILASGSFSPEDLIEKTDRFDLALGILFLRSDIDTLKTLEHLPDVLEELGLDFSFVALLYALGALDDLPKEFVENIPSDEMDGFFVQWAQQYSPEHLSPKLVPTEGSTVCLTSRVLGCTIIANVENQSPCIETAESILAALESFLSTSVAKQAIAHEPIVEINIDASAKKDLIEFETNNDGDKPVISVHCQKFNPHSVSKTDQKKIHEIIFDIVVQTTAHFVMFKDYKKDLDAIVGGERSFERALDFTSSFVRLGNVLGDTPKITISEITEKKKQYALSRATPIKIPTLPEEPQGDLPDKPDERSKMRHTDIETISVIKDLFWNEAKWRGVGYMVPPDKPPVFIILFTEIEAGKKIFKAWQKKFGREDKNEEIRISLVQNIDEDNPLHYRVGIGSNLERHAKKNQSRFTVSKTRMHTMTPSTLVNLENFKKAYAYFGYYLLAPGSVGVDSQPHIVFSQGIIKEKIFFRIASEIGPNDADIVLISKAS